MNFTDQTIFTLARLVHRAKSGALKGKLRVGGRLFLPHNTTRAILQSGLVSIRFSSHNLSPQMRAGDYLLLTVDGEDLDMVSSENEIVFQASKIADCIAINVNKYDLHEAPTAENSILRKSAFEIQKWSDFIWRTREYFHQQGLTEATTPSLVQNPGMEPELEPFATTWRCGKQSRTYFLPTSPELHLKKLMSQGFTDIFEIKTVYRNEEVTPLHQPEFTMLEWYRGFADLSMIEDDLCGLLNYLSNHVFKQNTDFAKLKKISVAEAFHDKLKLRLTPQTTKNELYEWAARLQLAPSAEFSWNDLFHLIWVAKIEPQLTKEPFLLYDYPPSQAALARINERGWADRFEFYWHGVEIANAFNELTDVHEQRERFMKDQKLRVQYGRTPLEIDEDFMTALERGLPPSGGIALGMDRLFKVFLT